MGGLDTQLEVRDVVSGAILHCYREPEGTRTCCFASKNEGDLKLVSAGGKQQLLGRVTVRNVRTGITKQRFRGIKIFNNLAFSPDGKYLASCGDEKKTSVRRLKSGERVQVRLHFILQEYLMAHIPVLTREVLVKRKLKNLP